MVFKREEELVRDLHGSIAAVKAIKNLLIGDKNKKASFVKVGAVPRLVEVVQQSAAPGVDSEPAVQALSALGSFAYNSEVGLRSLLDSDALPVFMSPAVLGHRHPRVVEAACRALKQVYASEGSPRSLIFSPQPLTALLDLLRRAEGGAEEEGEEEAARWTEASELAAQVLSVTCCEPAHQEAILAHSAGLSPILSLLDRPRIRSRQAGLNLLAALVYRNVKVASLLLNQGVRGVLQLARSDDVPTRLKAAQVLTCLAEAWPSDLPLPAEGGPPGGPGVMEEVVRVAMGVLLRMAADHPGGEAPRVLARLLASNEQLQKNACGSNTLTRLIEVLRSGELQGSKQKEGVVRAIASFCLKVEDNRRQVADGKVIPLVTALIDDPSPSLRGAACECLWALSRSFKALRSSFLETDVVKPLLGALGDADDRVRAGASASLCNMVLEYTPLKEQVIREGGIVRFASLSRPGGGASREVRVNSLWALENLVFMSKPAIREAVRKELPWDTLLAFAKEGDVTLQEKAFGILQNLLYGGAPEVQMTLDWSRQEVPALLQQRLASATGSDSAGSTVEAAAVKSVTNALYAAVNISTGTDAHKDLVLTSGIAGTLPSFIREEQPEEVQVSALWCLINLTWMEGKGAAGQGLSTRLPTTDRAPAVPSPALLHRLGELKKMGLEEGVRALASFRTPLFVRERAQGVIDAFARAGAVVPPQLQVQAAAAPGGASSGGGAAPGGGGVEMML